VDEDESNARLIAAAPDLLNTCEMLLRAILHLGASDEWVEVIEAKSAIAKAKGEV
jgi:hypothetical protein